MATAAQKTGAAVLGTLGAVGAAIAFGVLHPQNLAAVAGPSPAGTGYVYTNAGITQQTALAGNPGTQVAGWCDAGGGAITACAVSSGGGASTGLCQNLPAATGSGKTYACDDVAITCVDDPTAVAWKCYQQTSGFLGAGVDAGAFTVVVQSGNFMNLNQFGPAVGVGITNNANVGCAVEANASITQTGLWMVTMTGRFDPSTFSSYPGLGVCVMDGNVALSNAYCMGASFSGPGTLCYHQENYTLAGSRTANNNEVCGASPFVGAAGTWWFRLLNDSNTLHFQIAANGNNDWNDWLTANTPATLGFQGFCMLSSGAGAYGHALVYENQYGTPIHASVTNISATNPCTITTTTNTFRAGDFIIMQGNVTSPDVNSHTGYYATSVSPTSATLQGCNLSSGTFTSGGIATVLNR